MTRDDPTAFAPPPAFGPFRVLHQIGVGVLGPVFRTYEPARDRLVAVKVFRLDITPEQAQALADELSRAADAGLFHPSIVEPIAAGVEGTVAYRAEEYVAGESMDAAIRHYAPASLDKALPFLTQLAGAIDFARAAGVGHGALHLRDIFVTPEEARASGFGVVDALERVGIRAPVRRPYSAPERIAGERWGTPADVFSLSAIAYELLTGRRPAGTGDQIGLLADDVAGEHAAAIRTVLARAMDDDPARRYQSALAFASALEAAARGEHVSGALRDVDAMATVTAPHPTGDPIPPRAEALPILSADEPERGAPAPARDETAGKPLDAPTESAVDRFRDHAPAPLDAAKGLDAAVADTFASFETREPPPPALARPTPAEPHGAADHRTAAGTASGFAADTGHDDYDSAAPLAAAEAEHRPRTVLPLALMLMVGLLTGLGAGYLMWGGATPAPNASPAPTTAAKDGTESAKEFSEQAVAPPPEKAAPAPAGRQQARPQTAAAPPVPGDESAPAPVPVATSGSISVDSNPSRAGVTVNGEWRGRTPLSLDKMKFGRYAVRVVQPGYATAREEFTLSASNPERTLSFKLQPTPAAKPRPSAPPRAAPPARPEAFVGSIFVDSRPQGATVFVDGKAAGRTPVTIADVAIGSHVVRLELADHRHWSTTTRVTSGKESRVTGSLERIR